MKTLIVEDDFTSRLLLQELLKVYGPIHIAINGREAITAVQIAVQEEEPYDLICMDIMMPEVDGQQALREIRDIETATGIPSSDGAKIVMTTALGDIDDVRDAFSSLCDAYLIKPIRKADLLKKLVELGLTDS